MCGVYAGACGACGVAGRPLTEMPPFAARLYRQALADALFQVGARRGAGGGGEEGEGLCWECSARVAAFARFVRRAVRAQTALHDHLQAGQTWEGWAPCLQLHRTVALYCGPHDDVEPPPEPYARCGSPRDLIKPEPADLPSETYEDALALPLPLLDDNKPKKKKKKDKRKRTKKKLKDDVPLRSGEGDSSDGLSDLGSLMDLYTDEKHDLEQPKEEEKAKTDEVWSFTCEVCGVPARSAGGLRAHRAAAHPPPAPRPPPAPAPSARPRCDQCDKEFSSRKTYRYHLSVIHEGRNRYPCAHCGKVYQWKSNLWRHMKNHSARAAGELYCVPCRRAFASVATYTQHVRVSRRHVQEGEFRHACAQCARRFPTKTRLRDHVDWDHLQTVRHRCDACDKPFKSKMSLYVHVKNVHGRAGGGGAHLCHVCGKSYQNQAKLKYHIVAMHTGETPYACARCGAAFGWYSSLYRHQREVHDKIKVQPKRNRNKKGEAPPPAPPHPATPAPHLAPPLLHT